MDIKRIFRSLKRSLKKGTLKRTLVIYLLIACLLPILVFAGYTYSSIHAILKHKIRAGIEAGLKQEATGVENLLSNMDYVSKQFALDGQTAARINEYLKVDKLTERAELVRDIEDNFNVVNFTNPNLGLMVYYHDLADEAVLFSNLAVDSEFDIHELPVFVKHNGSSYFGPHRTQYKNSENTVFSSLREVRTDENHSLYIYLESNYNMFRKMMNSNWYGMPVYHYLINERSEAIFADEGEPPFAPDLLRWDMLSESGSELGGHYLFGYESLQGWKMVTAVDKSVFNHEINVWMQRVGILLVVSICLAVVLATLLWRKVYGSLRKVNREITRMTRDRESPVTFMQIEEFDGLLSNFQTMKMTVNELIEEIARNERNKSRLETEKLLSQINPHFLHNTLNSVQWLARSHGQDDIDRIVTLLVQVLHYNMGKQSLIVTLRDEINTLRNYIELQSIRYEGELEFIIETDPDVLPMPLPRFLLQPLVENAIYHGKNEEHGVIRITAARSGRDHIELAVEDNGPGMDTVKQEQLLGSYAEGSLPGMGIGLSYVKRLLEQFYGNGELLTITSEPGKGSRVSVVIPCQIKEVAQ